MVGNTLKNGLSIMSHTFNESSKENNVKILHEIVCLQLALILY